MRTRAATPEVRQLLRAILDAALAAVDPAAAVRRAMRVEGRVLVVGDASHPLPSQGVRLIAFGKASLAMASAATEVLETADVSVSGVVVIPSTGGPSGHQPPPRHARSPAKGEPAKWGGPPAGLHVVAGDHPVPGVASVAAADAVLAVAKAAGAGDLVVCLVSGGGSALVERPVPGLTLEDMETVTRLLLTSGADIERVNAVRKHLSTIKGGRLAEAIAPATVVTLAISDVVGDRPDVIASGPTVPDPTTYADALAALDTYSLRQRVPPRVRAHLEAGAGDERAETPRILSSATTSVIAGGTDAASAVVAAASEMGLAAGLVATDLVGEAREAAVACLRAAMVDLERGNPPSGGGHAPSYDPRPSPTTPMRRLWVWAGETTVTLNAPHIEVDPIGGASPSAANRYHRYHTTHGNGGRNQEAALAAALWLAQPPDADEADPEPPTHQGRRDYSRALGHSDDHLVFMAAGTDGIDGTTTAAGAIVDGQTVALARAAGLDAAYHLARHDSGGFFATTGELIITGPTGTNVGDLWMVCQTNA